MTRRLIASEPPRRTKHSWPTPDELVEAPELAILTLLDTNLELALRALVAAHPALADPDRPPWTLEPSPSGRAAEILLASAKRLHQALETYRDAVAPRHDGLPDDNAF
jgi:hypothetical protein